MKPEADQKAGVTAGAAGGTMGVIDRVFDEARVLVVDDNRVNIHLLSAILERSGIRNIGHALDGFEALEKVERFHPDLVLLDLMMPRMDGYETCQRLRDMPVYKDLPILVQSSLSRPEDRARAFAHGATDYVSKPINAPELVARLRIHLHNRFLVRSLQTYRERFETELAAARRMQERLLPQPAVIADAERTLRLRIAAHFSPSSELGGDVWGLRRDDEHRLVVWLVDFSGHGAASALHTFRLHAILNQMDMGGIDPGRFLSRLNRRVTGLLPFGQFATMLIGVIDLASAEFRYASAAATKPIVWQSPTAPLIEGDNPGLPLGIIASASYETRVLPFELGSKLFLYSDAAVEIPTDDGVLDENRFLKLVASCRGDDGADLSRILDALQNVGPLDDDLTAVLVARGSSS